MRIGEACALEWKDVDFDKEQIVVYKTLNYTKIYYDDHGKRLSEPYYTVQITTPKRTASNRIIPMNKQTRNAFLSWKEKQDIDKIHSNWGKKNKLLDKDPGLVFTSKLGNCFLPVSASKECKRICSIANCTYFTQNYTFNF